MINCCMNLSSWVIVNLLYHQLLIVLINQFRSVCIIIDSLLVTYDSTLSAFAFTLQRLILDHLKLAFWFWNPIIFDAYFCKSVSVFIIVTSECSVFPLLVVIRALQNVICLCVYIASVCTQPCNYKRFANFLNLLVQHFKEVSLRLSRDLSVQWEKGQ